MIRLSKFGPCQHGWHRSGDDEDWETVEEEDDDDDDDDDDSLLEVLFLDRFAHPVMNQPTRGKEEFGCYYVIIINLSCRWTYEIQMWSMSLLLGG